MSVSWHARQAGSHGQRHSETHDRVSRSPGTGSSEQFPIAAAAGQLGPVVGATRHLRSAFASRTIGALHHGMNHDSLARSVRSFGIRSGRAKNSWVSSAVGSRIPCPAIPGGPGQFPAPGDVCGTPLDRNIGASSDNQVLMIGKDALVPDFDRQDARQTFQQRIDPVSAIIEIDVGFRVKSAVERLLNTPGSVVVNPPIWPSRAISFGL